MKEKLTIIIPTHERHHLLSRAIEFYKTWKCKVIIADSSKSRYTKKNPDNIHYLHFPGKSICNKLYQASLEVTTPYTCLCADDDYLGNTALKSGIEYLDNNINYVSVSGNIIFFKQNRDNIHIRPTHNILESNSGYHVDSEIIAERVKTAIGRQHEYALHRSHITKKCFKVVRNLDSISPYHITFSLIAMCYGKHITLPIFWQARDMKRYSKYVLSSGSSSILVKDPPDLPTESQNVEINYWDEYLKSAEGIKYRESFVNVISDLINSKSEIENLFDSAFNEYVLRTKKRMQINELKRYCPSFMWKVYVSIRDSEMYSLMLKKKYLNKLGHPWVDQTSEKDWNEIMLNLEKHKNIQ